MQPRASAAAAEVAAQHIEGVLEGAQQKDRLLTWEEAKQPHQLGFHRPEQVLVASWRKKRLQQDRQEQHGQDWWRG